VALKKRREERFQRNQPTI